jgi:hypothetical protein
MGDLQAILQGKISRPRIITFYAVQGIGKSTWAASAPSPVFIQTEKGLDDIGVDRFPLAKSWNEVKAQLAQLCGTDHHYKTVVVDSLSALEPLIWEELCATKNVKNIEDFGYGKGYVLALNYWRELTLALTYLQESKGMNVILIGHSRVTRYENPSTDPYDRFEINIHKSASALIQQWSDEVLFANYEVFTIEKTGDFNKKRTLATGDGSRKIFTSERPAYKAKNRLNMPESIPMPPVKGWDEYAKFISK